MSKTATITILTLVASLLAIQAYAWGGYGGCPYFSGDAEGSEEYQAFYDATEELRKDLAVKQAELSAVMAADVPDAKAAGELTAEIIEIGNDIQAKAEEMGVTGYGPGNGPCAGPGNGPGNGRQFRRGPCGNW